MSFWNTFLYIYLPKVKATPIVPGLILLGSLIWACWHTANSASPEASLVLTVWGIAIFALFYVQENHLATLGEKNNSKTRGTGWCLALLALFFLGLKMHLLGGSVLLAAGCFFFGNLRLGSYASAALMVWIILVPNIEFIHHLISHPLRVIEAHATTWILSLFGYNTIAEGGDIVMENRRIAITAACSGIEQLEAMLLMGWLIAMRMQKNLWMGLSHFVIVLPVILFVNILRLMVTLLGVQWIGSVMLGDQVHITLGYIMVGVMILLFIGIGRLFDAEDLPPQNDSGREEEMNSSLEGKSATGENKRSKFSAE